MKRGRGRPANSAGAKKAKVSSDSPKRSRGRPPKSGAASANKKAVASNIKPSQSTSVDASKKKRGRPSKSSTPSEQVNGISKPQVNFLEMLSR